MLDKAEFKAWLEGHEPSARVGLRATSLSCPVAEWIKETNAQSYTEVTSMTVLWYSDGLGLHTVSSPEWLMHFVNKLDALNVRHITARRALQVLEQVKA